MSTLTEKETVFTNAVEQVLSTQRMNPDVKTVFLAALRSGNFSHGEKRLRDGDNFCVLGVLCNLFAEQFPDLAHWAQCNAEGEYVFRVFEEEGVYDEIAALPPSVAAWAGLDLYGRFYEPERHFYTTLAALNDAGKGFRYIADLVEKCL